MGGATSLQFTHKYGRLGLVLTESKGPTQKELQGLTLLYRDEVGHSDFTTRDVAAWMVRKNYAPLPPPADPLDILAKRVARAIREETSTDETSGYPYRVYHARTVMRAGEPVTLWGHIDELERDPMELSVQQRRQQVVGEVVQLSRDVEHWNSANPEQLALNLDVNFELDVQIARFIPPE